MARTTGAAAVASCWSVRRRRKAWSAEYVATDETTGWAFANRVGPLVAP